MKAAEIESRQAGLFSAYQRKALRVCDVCGGLEERSEIGTIAGRQNHGGEGHSFSILEAHAAFGETLYVGIDGDLSILDHLDCADVDDRDAPGLFDLLDGAIRWLAEAKRSQVAER